MTSPDPLNLIRQLTDGLDSALDYTVSSDTRQGLKNLAVKARAYLEEASPVTVKEQRPDRLVVGDIWEFETEVRVKNKRKPQMATIRAEVKRFHPGECAWQLQSLDGQHYFYLWENAPQYEEMTYIGTIKK